MSYTVWTVRAGTDDEVIVATGIPTNSLAESVKRNLAEVYEDLAVWIERD